MKRLLKWGSVATVAFVLLSCLGVVLPIEVIFFTLFGWLLFLTRVVGQVTVDWPTVLMSLASLAGFAVGLHFFLRWFSASLIRAAVPDDGASPSVTERWRWRSTAGMVAVLVMLFAAGTSMVGIFHQVAWWATSPEPTFTYTGVAARLNASANNLTQIGLGVHNYNLEHESLPPGATMDSWGRMLHGWQAFLLPYLEEEQLYDRIDFQVPWDHPRNAPVYQSELSSFRSRFPRDNLPDVDERQYPLTDYSANVHLMGGTRSIKLEEIADGSSRTLLAGEAATARKAWGFPANWRDPALGINRSPGGFGAPWNTDGANFVFADGHTSFISQDIDPQVLRALSTPAGGEAIDSLWD